MVAGWSLAGSPWARLPPIVARFRTIGSAMTAAVSARIGYFLWISSELLEGGLARPPADLQEAALLLDVLEARHPVDVDEVSGRAQPELEERQEALASREHLGVAVSAEELDRLGERAGSVVVERSRDHALSFRCDSL